MVLAAGRPSERRLVCDALNLPFLVVLKLGPKFTRALRSSVMLYSAYKLAKKRDCLVSSTKAPATRSDSGFFIIVSEGLGKNINFPLLSYGTVNGLKFNASERGEKFSPFLSLNDAKLENPNLNFLPTFWVTLIFRL